MPQIDKALCTHLLTVLRDLRGHSIPADALAVELEARAGRPVTTVQFLNALNHCKDSGWVHTRKNEWGEDVYWITEPGKNQLIA